MPDFSEMLFKRQFSLTMYKNKKFGLAEMSFYKDFINDKRGDLYPVLESCGQYTEKVENGRFIFASEDKDAHTIRLLSSHFPYASFEIKPEKLEGACGFSFNSPTARCDILFSVSDGKIVCSCGDKSIDSEILFVPGCSLIVSARKRFFDVFIDTGSYASFVCTFAPESFENILKYDVFTNTTVGVYLSGNVTLSSAKSYMDCGLSQADMRPIRYENGEIMVENGKVYLTMSIRMREEMYQGVFSWIPGTTEFELTGAIFFDAGDGEWNGDVASSVLYHRIEKVWYIWACSFSHDHVLCHAVSKGDVRFGINCLDVTLMEKLSADGSDTDFKGKQNDEDPDFIYDEKRGKWIMAICRTTSENGGGYKYHLFESDRPFDGYKFVSANNHGAETGGSFVNCNDGIYFVCGNDFSKRANYRVYKVPDMTNFTELKFDYDDGGFRGWGTVMPIQKGTRTEYYHLTFDRHNASHFNWSYGNIYCFKA